MKTSHAVLAAAAVGAAGLALSERHNRQRLVLHAAQMHQAWIAEVASNPELRAVWTPPGGDLPAEEYTQLLHCNRLISFLAAKYRVGLLDRHALRAQARWLMERDVARKYWAKFGDYRWEEAMGRTDHIFNAIMADEYAAYSDEDAVAV
ncbi:DUF6082 family protein [Streptomyces sp. E11-3]|uniref:DUF6082 family protein n=1 Tax=Streptomyces sp. E11-3 TaxID=3110112 RepID=UPI003980814D